MSARIDEALAVVEAYLAGEAPTPEVRAARLTLGDLRRWLAVHAAVAAAAPGAGPPGLGWEQV